MIKYHDYSDNWSFKSDMTDKRQKTFPTKISVNITQMYSEDKNNPPPLAFLYVWLPPTLFS